jgi:hypothetical protein
MKKSFFVIASLAVVTSAVFLACNSASSNEKSNISPSSDERIRRGEYLVATVGCDDCHSPKKMGPTGPEIIPELRLSGYPSSRPLPPADSNTVKKGWMLLAPDLTAAVGPWGVSYAANITSDASGIGNWTENQFIKTIREGKWMGQDNTRPLLPPMPWSVYKNMTDEDLRSIFAYLKTVPAVENVPPAPKAIADLK